MSKNTFSSAFRSLDVDKLSGGCVFDDDDDVKAVATSAPGFEVETVVGLLLSNQQAEALIACLDNAPVFSKDQIVKVTE